jgi:hypothetical protein
MLLLSRFVARARRERFSAEEVGEDRADAKCQL